MTTYDLPARRARYFALSSQIAHLDNAHLRGLFDTSEATRGWGRNHVLDIGQTKVFVKRVPLTELEHENLFSTKNLYELPTYYNYGVGSAGFGAFRELVANIKTTNWVLEGATSFFPLLYHYRIIPFSNEQTDADRQWLQGYVEYWNSNENIGNYIRARAGAPYELALFIEHMPYSVEPWLREHPAKIGQALEDLRDAATFLRENGVVHFDANFDNVLSDGEHAYLTDFGLVLDERFSLSQDEALFLKQGAEYDYAEILGSLGFFLFDVFRALPDADRQKVMAKYGVADEMHGAMQTSILLRNIEEIAAEGILTLDPSLLAIAVKYRDIIVLFLDFFASMRGNKQKDTPFPYAQLSQLLRETGFLSGSL
jgi:hypothetical protein